jgi:hypothetical protein
MMQESGLIRRFVHLSCVGHSYQLSTFSELWQVGMGPMWPSHSYVRQTLWMTALEWIWFIQTERQLCAAYGSWTVSRESPEPSTNTGKVTHTCSPHLEPWLHLHVEQDTYP